MDKTWVMMAARMKGHKLLDNQRDLFFPNISAELLKWRKVLGQVSTDMASLSIPDLSYGIVYLANLLMSYKRKCRIFDMVAEKLIEELRDYNRETAGEWDNIKANLLSFVTFFSHLVLAARFNVISGTGLKLTFTYVLWISVHFLECKGTKLKLKEVMNRLRQLKAKAVFLQETLLTPHWYS